MAPRPEISDEDFAKLYREYGASRLAMIISQNWRTISRRAERLRLKGIELEPPNPKGQIIASPKASARVELKIENGFVVVASDCHYWPGEHTLMHKALVWACKEFKPKVVVLNGDVMDLPQISKYPPINWEKLPEVQDEIEFAQEKTHEIAMAAGRGVRKIWTMGNHDKRFESHLAHNAPKYARVKGVHLKDHFPDWEPAWSAYINPEMDQYSCLIKHRFSGGVHDVWNNMLKTGNHCVTGHTHHPEVRALTYYNERTIWGVNSGMCAEPMARAFTDYTEDNPKNWRSAIAILRWENKKLLMPQLVVKHDSKRVQIGLDFVTL